MAATLVRVSDSVVLAHTPLVNWTLVYDHRGVVLVDAGYPGQLGAVLGSLAGIGRRAQDVVAVVLTHAHVDHFGTAVWFAERFGVPVYCHPDEVGHARRERLEQAGPVAVASRAWRPRWLKWSLDLIRLGGLTRAGLPHAAPLTEQIAAELPGPLVAVPTPGHTGGHCSYLVGEVLISGDALITAHPLTGHDGPQLLPALFNHDQVQCVGSLAAIAAQDVTVLVPGHGPVWRGSLYDAAAAATPARL